MNKDKISIQNFGPISDINVELGDLTILIGAQASGKTLFLEMLKLLIDKVHIITTLSRYNYVTEDSIDNILSCYLGEGLASLWTPETKIQLNQNEFYKVDLASQPDDNEKEKLFYVPAQRILSIADGRPKNFMEFDMSAPYVLRHFSETLRLFFQKGTGSDKSLFPLSQHLSKDAEDSFNQNIFHDGKVVIDERTGQKKMQMQIDGVNLPFMTWSAGQKEFMPLLMAFYCLEKTSSTPHQSYEYVVIEEPEMGLHPNAILSVLSQVLEFIKNGYKVIISTHSPVLLDFAWANKMLSSLPNDKYTQALNELLNSKQADSFSYLQDKGIKTYYFARKKKNLVESIDISDLDVSSDNIDMAEWGGISQFSSTASDIVSKYMAEYGE